MKRLSILTALFIVLVACSDDNNELVEGGITVSNKEVLNQTVDANDTSGTSGVSFRTTESWTSTIVETRGTRTTPNWVTIHPTSGGAGSHTITINLDVNTSNSERSSTIYIISGDSRIQIRITQGAGEGVEYVYINGVRWARVNLHFSIPPDTEHTHTHGLLFQWNRVYGWDGSHQGGWWRINPRAETEPIWGVEMPFDTSFPSNIWDEQNDPCRFWGDGGWRMPTWNDFSRLRNGTRDRYNNSHHFGIPHMENNRRGRLFGQQGGNSIFLLYTQDLNIGRGYSRLWVYSTAAFDGYAVPTFNIGSTFSHNIRTNELLHVRCVRK